MDIKTLEKTITEKLSVLSKDELEQVNNYVSSFINHPANIHDTLPSDVEPSEDSTFVTWCTTNGVKRMFSSTNCITRRKL
jgi:hypothetical protein